MRRLLGEDHPPVERVSAIAIFMSRSSEGVPTTLLHPCVDARLCCA